MTVKSRGWWAQIRRGLDPQTATTTAIAVGVLIVSVIAARAWGEKAMDVVLTLFIAWLLWDRLELLERSDDGTDSAAYAHERIDALILAGPHGAVEQPEELATEPEMPVVKPDLPATVVPKTEPQAKVLLSKLNISEDVQPEETVEDIAARWDAEIAALRARWDREDAS